MEQPDKAVLRLAAGLGLAVLAAYAMPLAMPYAVCVMAVLVLCTPGPPVPFLKGVVMGMVIGVMMAAGMLMVPILEHYALAAVVLTGALLYLVFLMSGGSAGPQVTILAMTITLIPVAGIADPALPPLISATLAAGIGIGVLVSSASHAFFPDVHGPASKVATRVTAGRETDKLTAVRAVLVVMPVFVLALANPVFYLPAIMKTVALGQQAGSASARSAGRELVGSTLMGAWMATLVWFGLLLRPNLWMLTLWMVTTALWTGARLFKVKATSLPSSFWRNALVTMLILLGPAIEDSANGKDVLSASAIRVALFVSVALYAWAMVWVLERWRASHPSTG